MKDMGTQQGRVGDLEINQDLDVQHVTWKLQRVGWLAIGLLVLAGLIGLLGHGPVSKATGGDPSGPAWMDYDRFGRYHASSHLRLHIRPPLPDKLVRLWISADYLSAITLGPITPSPWRSSLRGDGVLYEFTVDDMDAQGLIVISVQPDSMGPLTGSIRISDVAIEFTQFIFP